MTQSARCSCTASPQDYPLTLAHLKNIQNEPSTKRTCQLCPIRAQTQMHGVSSTRHGKCWASWFSASELLNVAVAWRLLYSNNRRSPKRCEFMPSSRECLGYRECPPAKAAQPEGCIMEHADFALICFQPAVLRITFLGEIGQAYIIQSHIWEFHLLKNYPSLLNTKKNKVSSQTVPNVFLANNTFVSPFEGSTPQSGLSKGPDHKDHHLKNEDCLVPAASLHHLTDVVVVVSLQNKSIVASSHYIMSD